jgi:hypothetical protein
MPVGRGLLAVVRALILIAVVVVGLGVIASFAAGE